MKWIKRTFISIVRKPAQSILMFIIVFVLGNVLFASIAIKQTSEDVRIEMRTRIPSYLNLELTHYQNKNAIYMQISNLIEELQEDERVISVVAQKLISLDSVRMQDENDPYYNPEQPYDIFSKTLQGIENVDDSIYEYEIVEGRYFTQEELDRGDRKILIPVWDSYSQLGEYKIGDKIKYDLYNYKIVESDVFWTGYEAVPDFDNLIEYEFEIIGIYSDQKIKDEYEFGEENMGGYIEIPEKCAEEIDRLQQEAFSNHSLEDKKKFERLGEAEYRKVIKRIPFIKMSLKGLDASEQLYEELLSNPNFPKSYYKMTSAVEDYRYIQAPLENLVALADVALWASVVLVVVLLGLVSILFIRNRTFEIGILMAVGEKKLNVLMQFMLEIVLVGLLATSFSMVTGNVLGDMISEEFMRIQIDADYEREYQEKNPDVVTQLDLLETYDVKLDAGYIVTIYAISTLILVLSSAAPVLYILNIKPKKVLM